MRQLKIHNGLSTKRYMYSGKRRPRLDDQDGHLNIGFAKLVELMWNKA